MMPTPKIFSAFKRSSSRTGTHRPDDDAFVHVGHNDYPSVDQGYVDGSSSAPRRVLMKRSKSKGYSAPVSALPTRHTTVEDYDDDDDAYYPGGYEKYPARDSLRDPNRESHRYPDPESRHYSDTESNDYPDDRRSHHYNPSTSPHRRNDPHPYPNSEAHRYPTTDSHHYPGSESHRDRYPKFESHQYPGSESHPYPKSESQYPPSESHYYPNSEANKYPATESHHYPDQPIHVIPSNEDSDVPNGERAIHRGNSSRDGAPSPIIPTPITPGNATTDAFSVMSVPLANSLPSQSTYPADQPNQYDGGIARAASNHKSPVMPPVQGSRYEGERMPGNQSRYDYATTPHHRQVSAPVGHHQPIPLESRHSRGYSDRGYAKPTHNAEYDGYNYSPKHNYPPRNQYGGHQNGRTYYISHGQHPVIFQDEHGNELGRVGDFSGRSKSRRRESFYIKDDRGRELYRTGGTNREHVHLRDQDRYSRSRSRSHPRSRSKSRRRRSFEIYDNAYDHLYPSDSSSESRGRSLTGHPLEGQYPRSERRNDPLIPSTSLGEFGEFPQHGTVHSETRHSERRRSERRPSGGRSEHGSYHDSSLEYPSSDRRRGHNSSSRAVSYAPVAQLVTLCSYSYYDGHDRRPDGHRPHGYSSSRNAPNVYLLDQAGRQIPLASLSSSSSRSSKGYPGDSRKAGSYYDDRKRYKHIYL